MINSGSCELISSSESSVSATIKYLESVSSNPPQVVIVGKDPFPRDATGIPFCKPTWEQQLASNCSGQYVLRSIGVDLAAAKKSYSVPSELFEGLGLIGIVFLNASYDFIGKKIRKSKHLESLSAAYRINAPFIRAAKAVIYCGEASKIKWIAEVGTAFCVVHPDIRNRANPKVSGEWAASWSENALREKFDISIYPSGLPQQPLRR